MVGGKKQGQANGNGSNNVQQRNCTSRQNSFQRNVSSNKKNSNRSTNTNRSSKRKLNDSSSHIQTKGFSHLPNQANPNYCHDDQQEHVDDLLIAASYATGEFAVLAYTSSSSTFVNYSTSNEHNNGTNGASDTNENNKLLEDELHDNVEQAINNDSNEIDLDSDPMIKTSKPNGRNNDNVGENNNEDGDTVTNKTESKVAMDSLSSTVQKPVLGQKIDSALIDNSADSANSAQKMHLDEGSEDDDDESDVDLTEQLAKMIEEGDDDYDDGYLDDDDGGDDELLRTDRKSKSQGQRRTATSIKNNIPKTANEVDGYHDDVQQLESVLQWTLQVTPAIKPETYSSEQTLHHQQGIAASVTTGDDLDNNATVSEPMLDWKSLTLQPAGRLLHYIVEDRTIIVESNATNTSNASTGGGVVLDEGTVLFVRNDTNGMETTDQHLTPIPLGKILEVFGPIRQPLYSIRLPPPLSTQSAPATKATSGTQYHQHHQQQQNQPSVPGLPSTSQKSDSRKKKKKNGKSRIHKNVNEEVALPINDGHDSKENDTNIPFNEIAKDLAVESTSSDPAKGVLQSCTNALTIPKTEDEEAQDLKSTIDDVPDASSTTANTPSIESENKELVQSLVATAKYDASMGCLALQPISENSNDDDVEKNNNVCQPIKQECKNTELLKETVKLECIKHDGIEMQTSVVKTFQNQQNELLTKNLLKDDTFMDRKLLIDDVKVVRQHADDNHSDTFETKIDVTITPSHDDVDGDANDDNSNNNNNSNETDVQNNTTIDPWSSSGEWTKIIQTKLNRNELITVYYVPTIETTTGTSTTTAATTTALTNSTVPLADVIGRVLDTASIVRNNRRGCDASNIFDEEISNVHEMDFSDDEQEREAKKNNNSNNNNTKSNNNNHNNRLNNRTSSISANKFKSNDTTHTSKPQKHKQAPRQQQGSCSKNINHNSTTTMALKNNYNSNNGSEAPLSFSVLPAPCRSNSSNSHDSSGLIYQSHNQYPPSQGNGVVQRQSQQQQHQKPTRNKPLRHQEQKVHSPAPALVLGKNYFPSTYSNASNNGNMLQQQQVVPTMGHNTNYGVNTTLPMYYDSQGRPFVPMYLPQTAAHSSPGCQVESMSNTFFTIVPPPPPPRPPPPPPQHKPTERTTKEGDADTIYYDY